MHMKQEVMMSLSLVQVMLDVKPVLRQLRMGAKTLMLTINLDMVAFMPCNPSVGGPAKGIVVREIDALGGEMGRNIDKTHIQMRMLNTGKGPAVRAFRAQADKFSYQHEMKKTIEKQPNLTLIQGMVERLIIEDGVCEGCYYANRCDYGENGSNYDRNIFTW